MSLSKPDRARSVRHGDETLVLRLRQQGGVAVEQIKRIGQEILDALAGRVLMRSGQTQLKIERCVVLAVAVLVVHVFVLFEIAPERLGHNESMLRDVAMSGSHGVVRSVHEDITVRIDPASAAPSGCSFGADASGVMSPDVHQGITEVFIVTLATVVTDRRWLFATTVTSSSQQVQDIGWWGKSWSSDSAVLSGLGVMPGYESWRTVAVMALESDSSATSALANMSLMFHKTNTITEGYRHRDNSIS